MEALRDPIAAIVTPVSKRPPLLRRIAAKLREQLRFSLATMLEWMAAYTLAFAAAWSRADNALLSGACLGIIGFGLILRIAVRSEGRRVPHYLVFALAMALGAYSGAYVLRDQRIRAAAPLLEQAERDVTAVEAERAGQKQAVADEQAKRKEELKAEAMKSLSAKMKDATDEQLKSWVDQEWLGNASQKDRIKSGSSEALVASVVQLKRAHFEDYFVASELANEQKERDLLQRSNLLKTRLCQIKQEAESMDVRIVPLPATANGWSPLLVPVERRKYLHISADLIDTDPEKLKRDVWELTGLRCEFSQPMQKQILTGYPANINLRVTDMSAELWILWVCRLGNWKCEFKGDKVLIDEIDE